VLDAIKQAILARHKTIHAFCRDNAAIKRSTLYMVLSGKYPGNNDRQIAKNHAIITGETPVPARPTVTAKEAYAVLQQAKCVHCRKLDKRGCSECNTQTAREAQALEEYLNTREVL
jgi:hypothetical protein